MPANPRPACHRPSWNPDTNRDSWIWPDKHHQPQKTTQYARYCPTRQRCEAHSSTALPCTSTLLSPPSITFNALQFKGLQRPTMHQRSHLIIASSCFLFLWSRPDSCFLVLCVLISPSCHKHSARTIQPRFKKRPAGWTGKQMEAFLFETVSLGFFVLQSNVSTLTAVPAFFLCS